MYVTLTLWIAVALCALVFATSGYWQTFNKRALKPALASGSPLAFGIMMTLFALACVIRGLALALFQV